MDFLQNLFKTISLSFEYVEYFQLNSDYAETRYYFLHITCDGAFFSRAAGWAALLLKKTLYHVPFCGFYKTVQVWHLLNPYEGLILLVDSYKYEKKKIKIKQKVSAHKERKENNIAETTVEIAESPKYMLLTWTWNNHSLIKIIKYNL